MRILKDNWTWIVVPALLVFFGVLAVARWSGDTANDAFIYDL